MDATEKVKMSINAYYGMKFAHLIMIIIFIVSQLSSYQEDGNKRFIYTNVFIVLFITGSCIYAAIMIEKYSNIYIMELFLFVILAGLYTFVLISEYSECSPSKGDTSNVTALGAKESPNLEANTRPSNLESFTNNLELTSYSTNPTVEFAIEPNKTYDDFIRKINQNLKEKHYYFYYADTTPKEIYKSTLVNEYFETTDIVETADKSSGIPGSINIPNSADIPDSIYIPEIADMAETSDLPEISNISEAFYIHKTEIPETTVTPFKDSSEKSTKNLKCSDILTNTLLPALSSLTWQVIIVIIVFLYRKYMKEIISHEGRVEFHQTNDGEGVVNLGFQANENILEDLEPGPSQLNMGIRAGPSDLISKASNIFELFNTPERSEGRTDPVGNRKRDAPTSNISELSSDFHEIDYSEYLRSMRKTNLNRSAEATSMQHM